MNGEVPDTCSRNPVSPLRLMLPRFCSAKVLTTFPVSDAIVVPVCASEAAVTVWSVASIAAPKS